jgi:hypothetical protein
MEIMAGHNHIEIYTLAHCAPDHEDPEAEALWAVRQHRQGVLGRLVTQMQQVCREAILGNRSKLNNQIRLPCQDSAFCL